jgi:hypothetical protein
MSHKDTRGDTFSSRRLFDEALAERKLSTTSKSSVMTETRLRAGVPVAEWNHMTHRGVIFSEAKTPCEEEKTTGIVKPITEPGDKATVVKAESSQRPRADAMLIEKLSGDTEFLGLVEVVRLLKSIGFKEKIVASALGGTIDDIAYYYIVTEAEELFGLYGVRIVGGNDVYSFDTEDSGVFDDLSSAKKEMAKLASKPMTEQKLLAESRAATAAFKGAGKGIGKALWHASGAADIPALSDGAAAAAKLRASRAKKRAEAARRR